MSRAITDDFLAWFKQTSERRWWRNRWLPGLIEPYAEEVAEICEVERPARFVPLDGHFYVICESDPAQSKVCSVSFFEDYGGSVVDGVLIEDSLQDYLVKWFIVMGPFDWRCALFNPVGFVFSRLLGTIRYVAAVRAAWRTIKSIR